MGQYWLIANLDERYRFGIGNLWEIIVEGGPSRLFSALHPPDWKAALKILQDLNISYRRHNRVSSRVFDKLPDEIIGMIFSEVDNLNSAFCLACTCTRLSLLGEKRVRQFFDWRGDRIICVGEYIMEVDGDLPEGLVLGEDFEYFCDDILDAREENPENSDDETYASLYGWVQTDAFKDFEEYRLHDYKRVKEMTKNLARAPLYKGLAEGLLESDFKASVDEKPVDIVWNLSKKCYFRREADVKATDGQMSDWDMLGTILLLQICWSSDSSTKLCYEGNGDVHRGNWAGDRITVTRMEEMDFRTHQDSPSTWKDVSEEVVGLFVNVIKAETREGSDWKDYFNR